MTKPRKRKPTSAKRRGPSLAGGASMYGGADYQADFGVMRVLEAVDQMRRSPSFDKELGLELSGRSSGEVWDYFETGSTRAEMKLNPARFEDVREFVLRAYAASAHANDTQFVLVVGSSTGALAPLEHLISDAMTTSSAVDFRERINERDDVKRIAQILHALKGDAYALLRRMKVLPYPAESIRTAQHRVAANLVGEDYAADLINGVKVRLIDRAKQQRPWKVYELVADLKAAGFVFLKPPFTSLSDIANIAHGPLVVMQTCAPYELPGAVLAAAANISEQEIALELSKVPIVDVRQGHWQLSGDWQFDDQPFTQHLTRALQALVASVKATPDTDRVSSYINAAVAVATLLKTRVPDVVMTFFIDLDRDLKRRGNKYFVARVAALSLDAARIHREATKQTNNEDVLREIREARARTLICGVCWQLQRTGRLESAEAHARAALELGPGAITHAYSLKCLGRLRRLQAEEKLRTATERVEYLADSEKNLTDAIARFTDLADFPPKPVEIGDCYSLLGRTMLVAGDVARAKIFAAKADDFLVGYEETKATLDLRLLRGDIFRADRMFDAALSEYQELLRFPFSNDAEQNEIKARLHEAIGDTLVANNRRSDALQQLDKAIEIYTSLDEMSMANRIKLKKRRQEGMPHGLMGLIDTYPDHLILHALEVATAPAVTQMRRDNVQGWSVEEWRKLIDRVKPSLAITPAGELDW